MNHSTSVSSWPILQNGIDDQEVIPTLRTNTETTVAIKASEETYMESILPIFTQSYPNKHKVLGVFWNVAQDPVHNRPGWGAAQMDPTKRNVISLIRQIHDPLKFLSCHYPNSRSWCCVRSNWDGISHWKESYWSSETGSLIASKRVDKSNSPGAGDEMMNYYLYSFCDAAYAAVVYILSPKS